MTRRVLALSAVLAIATAAYVQATPYARAPLVADSAVGPTDAQVARETSCQALRLAYQPAYNVWRGGVKKGREPADQLDLMRRILARIGKLERAGRCGG